MGALWHTNIGVLSYQYLELLLLERQTSGGKPQDLAPSVTLSSSCRFPETIAPIRISDFRPNRRIWLNQFVEAGRGQEVDKIVSAALGLVILVVVVAVVVEASASGERWRAVVLAAVAALDVVAAAAVVVVGSAVVLLWSEDGIAAVCF